MNFEPRHIYHVYNQGNNKKQIFRAHSDYVTFLQLFKSYSLPYCDVLAWCLLPNHFHFMLAANDQCHERIKQGNLAMDPLTNGFRKLLSAYAHDFNKRNNTSGSLFRPKTKAKDLSQQQLVKSWTQLDYYANCFYYVHQNPFRHGLVIDLFKWKYSSFLFYAGSRDRDLSNKKLAGEICDYQPSTFLTNVMGRIPDEFNRLFESP